MSDSNTVEVLKSLSELYQNGSYKEAVDLILKHKDAYSPGVFHEQLGTLYLKLKDYGVARYHLEKAVKNGQVSTTVNHNLKTAKSMVLTPDMDSDQGLWSNFVSTSLSLPSGSFLAVTLSFVLLSLLLSKFKVIKNNLVLVVALVLSLSPYVFEKSFLDKINYGVVLKSTPLQEGPSKIYTQIANLEPGVKFIIDKSKDGWLLIKFPENLVGWVRKQDIGVFK